MSFFDRIKRNSIIKRNRQLFSVINESVAEFVFFSESSPKEFPSKYDSQIEPSTIFLDQPILKPSEQILVSKTDYYPCYYELSAEQKYKYYEFLSNPFSGTHDIGYVFLFYYGLERHLQFGDYKKTVDLIIRLRDIYSHPTFQAITRNTLVLSAIYKKEIGFLHDFLGLFELKNEYYFDVDLLIFFKLLRNESLTAKDIIANKKIFGEEKRYPPTNDSYLYEQTVSDCIKKYFGSTEISLDFLRTNENEIEIYNRAVYENLSLRCHTISMFDYSEYNPLVDKCHIVLDDARSILKGNKKRNIQPKVEKTYERFGIELTADEEAFFQALLKEFEGIIDTSQIRINQGYLHLWFCHGINTLGGVKLRGRVLKIYNPEQPGLVVSSFDEAISEMQRWPDVILKQMEDGIYNEYCE